MNHFSNLFYSKSIICISFIIKTYVVQIVDTIVQPSMILSFSLEYQFKIDNDYLAIIYADLQECVK